VPENFLSKRVIIEFFSPFFPLPPPFLLGLQGSIVRRKSWSPAIPQHSWPDSLKLQSRLPTPPRLTKYFLFSPSSSSFFPFPLLCGNCGTFSGVASYIKKKLGRARVCGETQGSDPGGRSSFPPLPPFSHELHPKTFDALVCDRSDDGDG